MRTIKDCSGLVKIFSKQKTFTLDGSCVMCYSRGGVGGGLGSTRSQALLLRPAETPRNPETCGNYLGPDIYFFVLLLGSPSERVSGRATGCLDHVRGRQDQVPGRVARPDEGGGSVREM